MSAPITVKGGTLGRLSVQHNQPVHFSQARSQAWLKRWERRYPKLTDWVEAHIGETLNFYRLPRQHHKHLKSTNMLERLNEEIKRRTRVVRIFPNPDSCLRLVRALCAETHEGWLKDHRYLNMDYLKEQKKELMQPGFPIWLWYFCPFDQSSRLDFRGFLERNEATEGDTQWVNYKPRPFSSRSTDF